jgi:hypothetical protein
MPNNNILFQRHVIIANLFAPKIINKTKNCPNFEFWENFKNDQEKQNEMGKINEKSKNETKHYCIFFLRIPYVYDISNFPYFH